MPKKNPTGGGAAVALSIKPTERRFLRSVFKMARDGIKDELAEPTQAQRADALHRTEIGLLERGARIPRIDTLVKVANALAVAPEQLIAGITWTPGDTEAGAFTISSPRD
jgi:hypothetical protein